MTNAAETHDKAIKGGLQGWSVKAPYPFIVMAMDNPSGMPEGLYWYVVDSRKGSTDFKDRCGSTYKGTLAAEWAHCHAAAMYLHLIEGVSLSSAADAYDPYWDKVKEAQKALKK